VASGVAGTADGELSAGGPLSAGFSSSAAAVRAKSAAHKKTEIRVMRILCLASIDKEWGLHAVVDVKQQMAFERWKAPVNRGVGASEPAWGLATARVDHSLAQASGISESVGTSEPVFGSLRRGSISRSRRRAGSVNQRNPNGGSPRACCVNRSYVADARGNSWRIVRCTSRILRTARTEPRR
jgi:hypothetical protein